MFSLPKLFWLKPKISTTKSRSTLSKGIGFIYQLNTLLDSKHESRNDQSDVFFPYQNQLILVDWELAEWNFNFLGTQSAKLQQKQQ